MSWSCIALSRDVPRATTRAVLLDGEELVIWRGSDGDVHIWEDRCPHRGMRLSFGFVRDNSLNCLYHGWTYGAGAQCVRIPAHPDLVVPASIRANARAVHEAAGMIWSSGDTEAATIPAGLPNGAAPVASLAVEAPPALLLGALPAPEGDVIPVALEDGRLYLAFHRVTAARTMLHAVVSPGATPAAAWQWLRRFRQQLEGKIAA